MRFRQRSRDSFDLNLTPLIDIVFLLLIFFMVTTTFERERALRVSLPKAETGKALKEREELRLTITSEGEFFLEGERLGKASTEKLVEALSRRARREALLVIAADRRCPHGEVVRALDAARRAGFRRVVFATEEG